MSRRVIHRVTNIDIGTPAWCDSAIYPEDGAREWAPVTCKRCIRIGGDEARDEIGAASAERASGERRP